MLQRQYFQVILLHYYQWIAQDDGEAMYQLISLIGRPTVQGSGLQYTNRAGTNFFSDKRQVHVYLIISIWIISKPDLFPHPR